ncbi:MAG: nitrogenase iron protein, partial [Deltaproteobacteria bacterium]|nr:nitrogenase iron protein [Deltaproteobacteria bacterium]
GGRAVSRMFEIFEEIGVIDENLYDVVIFDVLGDVVCGGFAAPMRSAFAPKVVIVLSEELASAYAGNNIAKGVKNYLDNGVCLAGVVLNIRDNQADLSPIKRFVKALDTEILGIIPRDRKIQEAEIESCSVLEYAPDSAASKIIMKLVEKLQKIDPAKCPAPASIDLLTLRRMMQGKN